MNRSYIKQHIKKQGKWISAQREYLSGLFTSRYGDEFYLHFICPLCGEQINQLKKLNLKSSQITVDFQRDVAGRMVNELRLRLADHYNLDCGSNRERKEKTANILIDKFQAEVYR